MVSTGKVSDPKLQVVPSSITGTHRWFIVMRASVVAAGVAAASFVIYDATRINSKPPNELSAAAEMTTDTAKPHAASTQRDQEVNSTEPTVSTLQSPVNKPSTNREELGKPLPTKTADFTPATPFRFPHLIYALQWLPDNKRVVVVGGTVLKTQSRGGIADLLDAVIRTGPTVSQSVGFVSIANLKTGTATASRLVPHVVSAIDLSPDGKSLALGGFAPEIALVDAGSLAPIGIVPIPSITECHAVRFSPDGRLLAVGGSDGDVFLVSLESKAVVQHVTAYPNIGAKGPTDLLGFSTSGDILSLGFSTHLAHWNVKLQKLLYPQQLSHPKSLLPFLWSRDGRRSLAMSPSILVSKSDVARGVPHGSWSGIIDFEQPDTVLLADSLHRNVGNWAHYEKFLQFHPSAPQVHGEIAYKGVLATWSDKDGSLLHESQSVLGWMADCEISPDGTMAAVVDDNTVRIWRDDGSSFEKVGVPRALLSRLAYAASEPYSPVTTVPQKLLDRSDVDWCFRSGDAGLAMICEGIASLETMQHSLVAEQEKWLGQTADLAVHVGEATSQQAASLAFRPHDEHPDDSDAQEKAAEMAAAALNQWHRMEADAKRYSERRPRIWRRLLTYWPMVEQSQQLPEGAVQLQFHSRAVVRFPGPATLTNVVLRFEGVPSRTRQGGFDPRVYFLPKVAAGTEIDVSGIRALVREEDDEILSLKMWAICDQGYIDGQSVSYPLEPDPKVRAAVTYYRELFSRHKSLSGTWTRDGKSGSITIDVSEVEYKKPRSLSLSGTMTAYHQKSNSEVKYHAWLDTANQELEITATTAVQESLKGRNKRTRKTTLRIRLHAEGDKLVGKDNIGTEYEFAIGAD